MNGDLENFPQLRRAPIVEAILDIDCDLPSATSFEQLEERARPTLQTRYPKRLKQLSHEIKLEGAVNAPPKLETNVGIQAVQFKTADERQIIQIRQQGFSFNRLAPYSSFDDYLPQLQWAWEVYQRAANPVRIRMLRLRYVNRILIPLQAGSVDLEQYIRIVPRMPDEDRFTVGGFLTNLFTVERETGMQVMISLILQQHEQDKVPVILDITAVDPHPFEDLGWSALLPRLAALRALKNRTFRNSLQPQCIALFQQ